MVTTARQTLHQLGSSRPAPLLSLRAAKTTCLVLAMAVSVCAPVLAAAGRFLNFPGNRNCGKLSVIYESPIGLISDGSKIADARGRVKVPSNQLIRLDVNWEGSSDLSFLQSFGPQDLQGLMLANSGHGFALEDASVDNFVHLKGLKQLSIEQTDIGDSGIKKVCQLTGLRYLNLSHTMMTWRSAPSLAALNNLTELEMDGTQLNDDAIAGIANLTNLRSLYIKSCGIGPGAIRHLQKLKNLARLRLNENKIGDGGIAALPAYPELYEMHLAHIGLTDAGCAYFAKFPKLSRLFIEDAKIGKTGLREIAKLKKLQTLDITNIPLDANAISELRSAPSLTQVWMMPKPGQEEAIKKALPRVSFQFMKERSKVPLEFFEPLH